MSANFYAHIARTLQAQPAASLLVWPAPPATHSGAEIAAAVAAIRQQLTTAGVQPGQRVLLLVPVSFGLVASLLGILAHGAVAVLPPPQAGRRQVLGMLRRGSLTAAVLAQPPGWGLRLLARLLGVKLLSKKLAAVPAALAAPPAPVPPDQPALITHTSGSTGQPKQIVRTHRVLNAQHAALKAVFPPWPGQRDCPLFPNVLLHNMAVGATSILPAVPWADWAAFDPAVVAAQLQTEAVQTLTGNVHYFRRLLPVLQAAAGGFPLVRAAGVGGSPVPEWLAQALRPVFPNATIYVIYGASEAEPMAVRALTGAAENPALGYAVGPLHPSLEWQLQPLGELHLPTGERRPVGEIVVRGPHVASAAPGGWLRTGDFGYVGASGQLYLTGRRGNESLRDGAQHYQLEHVVQHLPGVGRAAARPVAGGFAVFVQGTVSAEAVRAALAAALPAVAVAAVHFRAALPVDARHFSKIRYAAVQ